MESKDAPIGAVALRDVGMSDRTGAVLAAPLDALRAAYTAFHPPRTERRRRPEQFGLKAREVAIPAGRGGRTLAGWYCPGERTDRVALLGHGLGLDKSRSLPYARALHQSGHSVLLFDYRNHGDSFRDRGFTGFDRKFAQDTVAAARCTAALTGGARPRLILYGFSLSSFAMLRALRTLHRDVDAVVCDSGPACDPPAISPNLLREGLLTLPERSRDGRAATVAERSFELFNHLTIGGTQWPPAPTAPGYATTPMLFIGGGADTVVPAGEILALARRYPHARTLVLPEARHLRGLWTDKERYTSTVLEFLDSARARTGSSPQAVTEPTRTVHR
ncbi:alpha/beta hydrolase [Streptomyces sp. NPDC006711]|uniref:alpha/beta hydrolase n=1 Tax=unclassified Streptomyces TaxID=2593676 RepID=UPI0036C2F3E1